MNYRKLKLIKTVTLVPTAPFAFDSTFHKPDHFTSGDNIWEEGVKWQTWNWRAENIGLKFTNRGSTDKPKISVAIYAAKKLTKEFIDSLTSEIIYRYNLNLLTVIGNEFCFGFKKER